MESYRYFLSQQKSDGSEGMDGEVLFPVFHPRHDALRCLEFFSDTSLSQTGVPAQFFDLFADKKPIIDVLRMERFEALREFVLPGELGEILRTMFHRSNYSLNDIIMQKI